MNALFPALAATVGPILVLAPIVYALRPQGGSRWLRTRPVPARKILARCHVDREQGLIPSDAWGDVTRPAAWTVPAGQLPVMAAAR